MGLERGSVADACMFLRGIRTMELPSTSQIAVPYPWISPSRCPSGKNGGPGLLSSVECIEGFGPSIKRSRVCARRHVQD
jgi:hypothetical protein